MMAAWGSGGTWDSALSAGGFAAIRSVGFEPAGQVFGAAVYYLSATAGVSCPGNAARQLLRGASPEAPGRSLTTVSGQGIPGPAARIAQALYDGRQTAIDRMTGECADLGGHGIVGAALQVREIPADGLTAGAVEFKVIGTAVRASGCPPLPLPFATDLSGPDFAKLVMAGWMPAGIALGISVAALHDNLLTTSSGPWGTGNAEVPAYTDLMVQVRQEARNRLKQAVRPLGADGVVVSAMTVHVRSDACRAHPGGTDHFAEAVTTGTAVARFAERHKAARPPSLAVLPLG
ncbi:MAG: heavy metal-binding domain-containing protein [Streptosporangiaceae bacterium]